MATLHTYVGDRWSCGAGLRAALETSQPRSHCGDNQAVSHAVTHRRSARRDVRRPWERRGRNWEWHAYDTIKGSDSWPIRMAVEVMCREAIDAVLDLERWGLPFNRTPDEKIRSASLGGHTRKYGESTREARGVMQPTGPANDLQTLFQQCVKNGVNSQRVLRVGLDNHRRPVAGGRLRTGDGRAACLQCKDRSFLQPAGMGRFSGSRRNAHALTGDRSRCVLRRGLPLEDMDSIQFHPTGSTASDPAERSRARRRRHPSQRRWERFMERYAPTIKDLAPRDMVSRAIYFEIKEGRGAGPNKDYVPARRPPRPPNIVEEKLPDITEFARIYLGVEPLKEGVPSKPPRLPMGGIPTTSRPCARAARI